MVLLFPRLQIFRFFLLQKMPCWKRSDYSGPDDLSGVQYTIRPKKGATEKAAVAQIQAYFEQNVQLINWQ